MIKRLTTKCYICKEKIILYKNWLPPWSIMCYQLEFNIGEGKNISPPRVELVCEICAKKIKNIAKRGEKCLIKTIDEVRNLTELSIAESLIIQRLKT